MRPLIHPAIEDIRPDAILHALSDPARAAIIATIKKAGCDDPWSAVACVGDRVIPKSSLSNHIKILRDAGLIRSERHGVEVRNAPRWDEEEARFPGLLPGIINAYATDLSNDSFAAAAEKPGQG